ncbi:MAG: hypothetical protein KIT33_08915 [Candidatus Kapabacteria bacterium]|nr:hypothetical protein [Ignavibacteriota bacterium]MCW5885077.1 hypothetical protein [Candidatus Kapabacteria bacterium]
MTEDYKILVITQSNVTDKELIKVISGIGGDFSCVTVDKLTQKLYNFKPDVILLDKSISIDDAKLVSSELNSLNFKDASIIALIDNKNIANIDLYIESGAHDFIFSPINNSEFRLRIRNHINLIKYKREWENQLRHLELLNKEKNEILAIAAHDLKNPIFSIQLLGKTIRDDTSLTKEELYEFSNDIVASCDRIIDIIKQLLDLNSIESGKINIDIKKQSIHESVIHFIELYKHKADNKDIKIILEKHSDGICVTDLVSFNNIFDNFLSNAIKYSPFGKEVYVRLEDSVNNLIVSVKDQGPGIPEAEQNKLFKRFAKISNKPTGGENSTGLGLSIVKKFSELINADIKFSNNIEEAGATFSVILPKS